MLPLRDANPSRRFPVVTVTLIAINVLIFLYQLTLPEDELYAQALVPYNVTHGFNTAVALTFLSSMFMHGGLLHIGGNMLYLWIFGDNVEDVMGPVRYVVFYLLAGIAAALSQVLVTPDTRIPMVGASGAIAGVLGAYLLLFPGARILTFFPYFFFFEVPAYVILIYWFVLQLIRGAATSLAEAAGGGVAWWAHVGGFVAGLALVKIVAFPSSAPLRH